MKLQSVSLLGAITLSCALLSACGSKEEQPAPQAQAKPVVEAPAPAPKPAPAPEPVQEEPALVPIQSLSDADDKPSLVESRNFASSGASVEQESSGPFVIQVSIQPSRRAANSVVSKLSDQGIKAYVAEVENPGELEGTFYRVRVGYFSSIANAQQFGKEVLAPQGYAGWVDNRKNDRIGQPSASEDM
ncbi:MAG: SPOR domain-containing protein [Fibrobacter sp.]|uniref:SPOR domain-containing protein n=1 Tax=Fibrobacter sp. TaxID=35828 RepID=UPI0025B8AF01|nr:SPOR domain-containing protein [Fibrobacter sp.]MBQ7080375.1 SPOR domain-containing protein [Fibrobacter sp.]